MSHLKTKAVINLSKLGFAMSLKDKAYRLYEYISQVYSIDLPVNRDVTNYRAELWWQADLIPCEQFKIKEFCSGNNNIESENETETTEGDAWLSVIKHSYESPPEPPYILKDWLDLSSEPTKKPTSKSSIIKPVDFQEDDLRVVAFNDYITSWHQWRRNPKSGLLPVIPEILSEWIDKTVPEHLPPMYKHERVIEQRFEDDKNRISAFEDYINGPWKAWAERVLPLFKANLLYDELFTLHQRLSVEGDRTEILWGHLFFAWRHSTNDIVYHPLMLTPVNLIFNPQQRNIVLIPSQTIPTKLDLDCLLNLDYPLKDELIRFALKVNNDESAPEVWSHNQMRGLASTITGFTSRETAEETNKYSEEPISKPDITATPTIYNAPVIFVRDRTRRLWIEDAKKIAESIYNGDEIPPFIRSLVADPRTDELPNPDDYVDAYNMDDDEAEPLLPLEYNDQQKEIAGKLKKHYGVLVQGPPGTGKSHTIANIISSLLAQGKRVLVTSQTENALRVLRNYIPKEIRSLCVSQLGNDTEAKKQLSEAVDSIGKRLAEKGSMAVEQRIQNIRRELRSIREEQAILRNKIKEWVDLDFYNICIDGTKITAYQAAMECSEKEGNHSWFPDKLSPETEPLLTNEELIEICTLLRDISTADRKSCLQYLPVLNRLFSPEDFENKISNWRSFCSVMAETENLRLDWGEELGLIQPDEISHTISILEEALRTLHRFAYEWQVNILDLIVTEGNQDTFWHDFSEKCISLQDSIWKAYQSKQGYKIVTGELPIGLDIHAALEELGRTVGNGRNPSNWLTRIGLSRAAKILFDTVKVDGHNLLTEDRINAAQAYFSYKALLKKIETLWNPVIPTVGGPVLDLTTAMPLVNIDAFIKNVRLIVEWKDNFHEKIKEMLLHIGCQKQIYHTKAAIEEYIKTLQGQLALFEKRKLDQEFDTYCNFLITESKKENAHVIWKRFAEKVKGHSTSDYEQTYNELSRLLHISKKVLRLKDLSNTLKAVAPLWYAKFGEKALINGGEAIPKDWAIAWRWRRLHEWLCDLHNRESVESLQNRLERARKKEQELITRLVAELTWKRQIENVRDHHYIALVAWANAMRRYGAGTGRHAQRYLSDAARAMVDAVGAVPSWIMPLHRVVQSFPAKPGVFDVIITDEASQCDLRALSVLFRANKVLVVGDPEQISPANVGIERDKVFELINQYLSDIPFPDTFTIDNSLYEITKAIPRMNRTLLTEHFRCVPQIIEFNNRLCPTYQGRLEPLRQPNPAERLEPVINATFVKNGFKNDNDINEPEAEALVEMLVTCCKNERYKSGGKNNRKRTMGVISLLGEKQAKHISALIAKHLDETEREERRIICGDAYAFQGDERDVMFLSMVVAPNSPFAVLNKDADRQRFNVATSRARDQVFLFHSIRLDDIRNPECVRYKLLNWYLNPPEAEIRAGIEILRGQAESVFEIEVGERIIKRGYKVISQYRPFPSDYGYRIDLVIQGEKNRVAVECDGDRYHGPEKWEYDQRREAQLRRAGLKFWRISGSAFYRNKEKSLEGLWRFLEDEGIMVK